MVPHKPDYLRQSLQSGKDSVGLDQVTASTISQVAVTATAETSAGAAVKCTAYNNKINDQLIKNNNIDAERAKEIKEATKNANSLDEKEMARGRYSKEGNVHKLYRDREGQYAADFGSNTKNGKRSEDRVIMEKVVCNLVSKKQENFAVMRIFILFLLVTLFTIVLSAPRQISSNNIGDVTNVDVNANIDIKSEVNVSYINMIWQWINKELGTLRLDEDGNIIPPNLPWNQN
ncbi:hypothetical protein PVAND_013067 [Polypedilum vanderplanki]|uniref:Uncharacterized protein n=1 Tax=Polypedilum vanderplanki TaxID=319348 RepID=A0A9J6CQB8_POLVA|nr:hypothetical protein PVAND_013067 [Polypedilum vanderplanki]